MYTAYILVDPRIPDDVRYVGVTRTPIGKRLTRHVSDSRRNYPSGTKKENWIGSLLSEGVRPIIFTVDTRATEDEIFEVETSLISYYTMVGCNLTNGTGGGRGFDPKWVNKTGKSLSELWADPAWIEDRVSVFKEYWSDQENRAAQSDRVSKYFENPDNRKRVSDQLKSYYATHPQSAWSPEYKAYVQSTDGFKRMVESKQDPEYKERMRKSAEAQFSDPESRKVSSEYAKSGWATLSPEQRRDRIIKGRLGNNYSWAKKHGRVLEITPKPHVCKEPA